jgi:TRAP-type mannitol/chloroaromatic compound transport system permease small subunit
LRSLTTVIDRLSSAVGLAAALLVLPLCGVMVWEVGARYLFDLPTFWAYEFSWMITGAHFALGMALVTRKRIHVRVDFLQDRFPPRVKAGIDAAAMGLLVLPMGAAVSWALLDAAAESWRIGEVSGESAWNPEVWPLRFSVAIGFALFTLQVLSETIKLARTALGRGDPDHVEP